MEPNAFNNADTLAVQELTRSDFVRLGAEWDSVASLANRDEPFFQHGFLRTWLDNFAPQKRLRVFVVASGSKLIAALPLVEDFAWLHSIPVRRLRAPANVHSNRFDLLCVPERKDALGPLWHHLRQMSGFDVIEIPDVPQDGIARGLLALAEQDGFPTATWESMRTPYIPLQGGYEALLSRLDSHFRQNLRRHRRKLEQKGKVEFERIENGQDLEKYLEEGFALEKAGWKGRGQTAIASDPVTRGFYAELARNEALRGRLALYFLRLQGRLIAFQFGIQSGNTYYLPKTSYSEDHSDCSPGQLLMDEVLRDCSKRGLHEFDFLGPAMSWKYDWTKKERVHHWLYIFNKTAAARTLHKLKFRIAPYAKKSIHRARLWASEDLEMEAVKRQGHSRKIAHSQMMPRRYIPALPTLWPHMLLGRAQSAPAFPFEAPNVRYHYFGRNGVWTLARLLNLEQGEVLVPAYHHGVEIEALLDAGVTVRYYRVGPRMQVDPEDIERLIGPQTRALYLIHYLGFPGPIEEARKIADSHGLPLIEDCALALLSKKDERPLGTFGDASIFSLYKTLPLPNGGALVMGQGQPQVTPDPPSPPFASTLSHLVSSLLKNSEFRAGRWAGKARQASRQLARQMVGVAGIKRVATGSQHFDRAHVNLGMSAWSRRIVLAQDFGSIVERRRRNYFFLLAKLREVTSPVFGELLPGVSPLFFPLRTPDKPGMMARLAARGIETVNFWSEGHSTCPAGAFPDVDALRREILEIPIHQDLDRQAMSMLADAVLDSSRDLSKR